MISLRFADVTDVPALLEIYRPYVEQTAFSFEWAAPSPEEFALRMETFTEKFPYLVAEEDGIPLGYAYAHAFHGRAAFDWTVETSIYVAREAHGKHIGKMLYTALLALLKAQGVRNVCALVTAPNTSSMAFHTAMGFAVAGILPEAGYKLGAWHSVTYYWLNLCPCEDRPQSITTVHQLPEPLVAQILQAAAEIS